MIFRNDLDESILSYIHGSGEYLWIGSRGNGLFKYHIAENTYQHYTYEEGLLDLSINGIEEDTFHNIWFSSNYGISRLIDSSAQINHFFTKDELPWTEFNHNAIAKNKDGLLVFGGVDGIVYFDPNSLSFEENTTEIRISAISKRNGDSNKIERIAFDRNALNKVVLNPKDQFFSIDFSISNLNTEGENTFFYRLNNENWINLGKQTQLQFAGLKAGRYTLQIRGKDESGQAIKAISLPILVKQIWYKQWWAIAIYLALLIAIIYSIFRLFFARSKLSAKLNLERSYNQQLKELAETKTKIFSYLAHEFKTPLTLIQGPAHQIYKQSENQKIQKWSKSILENSKRLGNIVQQVLKLSQMDEGKYEINWTEGDISNLCNTIFDSFKEAAKNKEIDYSIKHSNTSYVYKIDRERLDHIIRNLISNAIKFTPPRGSVHIETAIEYSAEDDQAYFLLAVKDTGRGIAEDHLPYIFERYYREAYEGDNKEEGSGIGLALVKEYVQLLNGRIQVESTVKKGSTFSFRIPVEEVKDGKGKTILEMANHSPERADILHQEKPLILIVDDNDEIRDFIKDCLEDKYQYLEASNGEEAYQIALEEVPDLILLDIMMPIKDGYETAKELKANALTSHIPCIMLTAKYEEDDRLTGLKSGVEAYLSKPFVPEELMVSINNLLHLRQSVIQNTLKDKKELKFKDDFMNELLQLIDSELSNPALNVAFITKSMGVSRTQLHRKITQFTGKSINQFVREYRLEQARKLLLGKATNVSEVCYSVGFTQPSYFSARYKEYFGHLPSEH